jgi:hypothetical protein
LVKKTGESEILRGIDVFLCSANAKSAIDREGSQVVEADNQLGEELTGALKLPPNADVPELQNSMYKLQRLRLRSFRRLTDGMTAIRRVAEQNALMAIKTGVDAKYQFAEVPAGSYVLFATFKFDFVAGCWEIPIAVRDSKTIQLNLENSNMTMSTSTGLGPWELEKPLFEFLPPEWRPRDNPQRK